MVSPAAAMASTFTAVPRESTRQARPSKVVAQPRRRRTGRRTRPIPIQPMERGFGPNIDATRLLPGHGPAWDGGVPEAVRLIRDAAAESRITHASNRISRSVRHGQPGAQS